MYIMSSTAPLDLSSSLNLESSKVKVTAIFSGRRSVHCIYIGIGWYMNLDVT